MKKFEIMDACKSSAKDFCETLLFCLEEDGVFTKEDGSLDEEFKKDYKEYLDSVLEMHYNTDIGEQGENITKYLDEFDYYDDEDFKEKETLLKEEEHKIEKWLKDAGYTDGCVRAGFEPIEGLQGRAMDFEYNGDIDELDTEKLADSIAENVIDGSFAVRVSVYDDKDDDVEYKILHKNMFCVEVVLLNK